MTQRGGMLVRRAAKEWGEVDRAFSSSLPSPAGDSAQRTPPAPTAVLSEEGYLDRVYRVFTMMDVRTALVTDHQLRAYERLVEESERMSAQEREDRREEIEEAKRVVNAIVHPGTGKKVFLPLRISMIVPMNTLLDACMLSARTAPGIIGAQVLNQTYNALHYYANRNVSNLMEWHMRMSAFAVATVTATTTALFVSGTWRQLIPSFASSAASAASAAASSASKLTRIFSRFAPFAAVAAADVVSLAIVRSSEYTSGVYVYDEATRHVLPHKSKRAGSLAVGACMVSRVAAAASILILTPLAMRGLDRFSLFRRFPRLRLPTMLGIIGTAIQTSVPITFGVFRQVGSIGTAMLEPSLVGVRRSELRDDSGVQLFPDDDSVIERVIYNKGM